MRGLRATRATRVLRATRPTRAIRATWATKPSNVTQKGSKSILHNNSRTLLFLMEWCFIRILKHQLSGGGRRTTNAPLTSHSSRQYRTHPPQRRRGGNGSGPKFPSPDLWDQLLSSLTTPISISASDSNDRQYAATSSTSTAGRGKWPNGSNIV